MIVDAFKSYRYFWLILIILCLASWQIWYAGELAKILLILASSAVVVKHVRFGFTSIEFWLLASACFIGMMQYGSNVSLKSWLIDLMPFLMFLASILMIRHLISISSYLSPPSMSNFVTVLLCLCGSFILSFLFLEAPIAIGGRLAGPLGPPVLAIYLIAVFIPILVSFLENARIQKGMILLVILLFVGLTYSRMPLAAMVISMIVSAIFYTRRFSIKVFIPIVVLCVPVLVFFLFKRMFVGDGFNLANIGLSGRDFIWMKLWGQIQDDPWFGKGFGSAYHFLTESNLFWTRIEQPHNELMRIMHNQGFIGLVTTLVALLMFPYSLLKRYFSSHFLCSSGRQTIVTALALWAGFFALALTDNVMVYPGYMIVLMWYTVSGLTIQVVDMVGPSKEGV